MSESSAKGRDAKASLAEGAPGAPTTGARPSVARPVAPKILSALEEPASMIQISEGSIQQPVSSLPVSDQDAPLEWFDAKESDESRRAEMTEAIVAMHSGGSRTLVEEGTEFKGSFTSTCPIEVKGRIDGDVAAPLLTVTVSGAVHGRVKVGGLLSQGEIAGELDADTARLEGVVKDNTVLRAKSLEMRLVPSGHRMQVIFGACTPNSPEPAARAVAPKRR